MKLYDVPNNTLVRPLTKVVQPPFSREIQETEIVKFHHIDGMYSYCHDKNGEVVHLAAWTDVEIV